DINEAIGLHQEALELRAIPHPYHDESLNNLANALLARFEHSEEDIEDINQAIGFHRKALKLCTAPHPGHSQSLVNLAYALCIRFEQNEKPKDLNKAMRLYKEASTYLSSSPLSQFSSSIKWAAAAGKHNHSSCLAAYHTTINLL
ncbi:hypothetical protein B0H19DRAFT_861967, partial [Mycena capillaripes]